MPTSPLQLDLRDSGGRGLRLAVALALATRTPVRLSNVRASHRRPGLLRRHVAALQAAATLSRGEVEGATVGSQDVAFRPGAIDGGEFDLRLGAGAPIVPLLRTILPAMLVTASCGEPTTATLHGATFAPDATTVLGWQQAVLPVLRSIGADVDVDVEQDGAFPRGDGRVVIRARPVDELRPIELASRGALQSLVAAVHLAGLPFTIAKREVAALRAAFGDASLDVLPRQHPDALGRMNAITIAAESERATDAFATFGHLGRRAESVADAAAKQARQYLATDAAVGSGTFDELLPFLALAGGRLSTLRLHPRARAACALAAAFPCHRVSLEDAAGKTLLAVAG